MVIIQAWEQREAEVKELKKEQEILIWNLAGCSTYALGYDLIGGHDKNKARPALNDVLKLAIKEEKQREEIKSLKAIIGRLVGALKASHSALGCGIEEGEGCLTVYQLGKITLDNQTSLG